MAYILYIILGILGIIKIANAFPNRASRTNLQNGVVGSELRNISEFPFFAGLIKKKGYDEEDYLEPHLDEDIYICGCSIIGNFWVVTTASCTQAFKEGYPLLGAYIRSGTSAWAQSKKEQPHMTDHSITKIVQHKSYYPKKNLRNISLIKVGEQFLGIYATRIQLAGQNYEYVEGSICTVIGFGLTLGNETTWQSLKSLDIKIANKKKCKQFYQATVSWSHLINSRNFCAGKGKVGSDECYFHSGIPLIQNELLIGIVSFGESCSDTRFPAIFTNISRYHSWFVNVEKEMGEGTGVHFVQNK